MATVKGSWRGCVAALVLLSGTGRALCQTASQSSEGLPDPSALLRAASDKEDAFAIERQKYVCTYKNNDMIKGTNRLYDSFYVRGREIERLLAVNGVPIAPDEKLAEEARVTAEIKADQQKGAAPFVGLAGGMNFSGSEHRWAQTVEGAILRGSTFSNERRVMYRNRPAIQIDFKGDRKFKPHTDEERVARGLAGTIIVDEESGAIVRIGADAIEDIYNRWGNLLAAHTIMFLGFDAVRIADNLYVPSSWAVNQYVNGRSEDFWLQSCRKYEVEMGALPGLPAESK